MDTIEDTKQELLKSLRRAASGDDARNWAQAFHTLCDAEIRVAQAKGEVELLSRFTATGAEQQKENSIA